MSQLNFPLIQSYRPASFRERGVAVPFTAPRLAGVRVRPAERTGTEFVVPNPSGGRGVYVLHWGGVRQLCAPTVHDTLLHQRIARLPIMDPGGVRDIARRLAAEGMAGKDAAAAAAATVASDGKDRVLVNFLLLITLMEQIEPAGLTIGAETERTPELDRRARQIVTRLGAAIGRSTVQIGGDLESLSGFFTPLGLDTAPAPARLPRLIARLDSATTQLLLWSNQCADDGFTHLAGSLAHASSAAASCATATIRAARDLTADMPRFIQAWARSPVEVAEQLSRPEWVLDGWERFCLLWETAAQIAGQRAALLEMAQLLPITPLELAAWNPDQPEMEARERIFHESGGQEGARGRAQGDTRSGATFGLIARNERLQALLA